MSNENDKQTHHHTHHTHHKHHKHRHHKDQSEIFKQGSFSSLKVRKLLTKYLFRALCVIAALIVAACVLLPFID